MSKDFSEDKLVQETTVNYLRDKLGWNTAYAFNEEVLGEGGTLGRKTEREVVLVSYLRPALEKLNPGIPSKAIDLAIEKIVAISNTKKLVHINQDKYALLKNGVLVEVPGEDGTPQAYRLQVFDFNNPEENHFLAVRELWVKGKLYRRRPDIIGFVNGIPLLFIECKAVHKNLQTAHDQNLKDYKDTIPEILHHNAIVMLSNGSTGKVGSITSKYGHFHEWKRLAERDPGRVGFETMLLGICTKSNFMDLVENFILFDQSTGKTVKILARNHQYLGVNQALAAVKDRSTRDGKLGVFWHTQGSGKSFSMVFLTQKILRKLGAHFTFVVVTDRDELDTQIYRTYTGTGAVTSKRKTQATSGRHLAELLAEDHRYVFTLIQKFNHENPEAYSTREDVIIISDEAHRTQYGKLARNMRAALPSASFIGFTGTPLMGTEEDELTKQIFGDYVSTYDFQRAVEDGATVPLYYDNRGEKLRITTEDLNQRIADEMEKHALDPDQEAKLRRDLARDYHIVTATKRLNDIAQDFVEHYTTNWKTGKAMLVCIDKLTCVKMHGLIQEHWEKKIAEVEAQVDQTKDEQAEIEIRVFLNWLKETQRLVVVSEEQNEVDTFRKADLDIEPHRKIMKEGVLATDGKRIDLETAFKDEDHPFRVAIVCAMWLTGFDVPTLSTIYIDKPMKGHTLMQAIARANRVSDGKNNGLIIDYNGMLKSLRQALATYAKSHTDEPGCGGETDPVKPREDQILDYVASIQACVDHLVSLGFTTFDELVASTGFEKILQYERAVEAVYTSDESKVKFEVLAREMFKKGKYLVGEAGIRPHVPRFNAIEAIYKKLQQNRDIADTSEIMKAVHDIVDSSIDIQRASEEPGTYRERIYDISQIDFDLLRREFAKSDRKNTALQTLKSQVEAKLRRMVEQNPTRIDYYKRYQEIIEEYNLETDRVTIEQTFEELLKLVESLSEEEVRAAREGLTEPSLAIFDVLKKDNLSPKERERVKAVANDLLDDLKAVVESMDQWREKSLTTSNVFVFIRDYLYDEATGLPDSYRPEEVDALARKVYEYVFEHFSVA